MPELRLELRDNEWEYTGTDHDRLIARAIVADNEGLFTFVHVDRDDLFGRAQYIETSGGGLEPGEDPAAGLLRELREELGAETEILCEIGMVSDYYNLIHRHNLNRYFLCRVLSFGEPALTEDEKKLYHLTKIRLTYDEAVAAYEKGRETKIGRLVANRELPVLRKAKEVLDLLQDGEN